MSSLIELAYDITPVPDWVKQRNVGVSNIDSNGSPYSYPFVDYQEYLTDTQFFSHRHTYQCIFDSSRLEDASLLISELHSGCQQLLIHSLTIIRDGERIDALDPENVSAIRRESSLESHIVDNRITVSIMMICAKVTTLNTNQPYLRLKMNTH